MTTMADPGNPIREIHNLRRDLEEIVERLNLVEGACRRLGVPQAPHFVASARGNLREARSEVLKRQQELKS